MMDSAQHLTEMTSLIKIFQTMERTQKCYGRTDRLTDRHTDEGHSYNPFPLRRGSTAIRTRQKQSIASPGDLLGVKQHHINTGAKENRQLYTVKILKFGTPQTFAIIDLKLEKFDVTLH